MKVKRFLLTEWEVFYPSPAFGDSVATADSWDVLNDYLLFNFLLRRKNELNESKKDVESYHLLELGNLLVSDLASGTEYRVKPKDLNQYEEFVDSLVEKYDEQLDISLLENLWWGFATNESVQFEKNELDIFFGLFFEKVDRSSMKDIVYLD